MYDSWEKFIRTGSTYSYLEYKENQRKKENTLNNGDRKI